MKSIVLRKGMDCLGLHHSLAAVSAHLLRLKAAELGDPHRSGKRVYYRLSCPGESLLGISGETG